MKDTTIIIPIKDEEDGLRFLYGNYINSKLHGDKRISFILVIDGRTNDSSKEIASKFPGTIIDQHETHGKGSAIKQALEYWKKNMTPYVIFMDADGSYSFESIPKIIKVLDNGADLVSGSRFIGLNGRPKGMGIMHNFGNKVLSKISNLKNRNNISDMCTGLWGFQSSSIPVLNIKSDGFDIEAEITGKASKNKLKHLEIPVNWSARKGGTTKLKSFKDGFIILLRILRN
jgi:hypothetical protein